MAGGAAKEAATLITTPIESRRQGDFTLVRKTRSILKMPNVTVGRMHATGVGNQFRKSQIKKAYLHRITNFSVITRSGLAMAARVTPGNAEVLCPPCHIAEHR